MRKDANGLGGWRKEHPFQFKGALLRHGQKRRWRGFAASYAILEKACIKGSFSSFQVRRWRGRSHSVWTPIKCLTLPLKLLMFTPWALKSGSWLGAVIFSGAWQRKPKRWTV